jgi:hypothetical protein
LLVAGQAGLALGDAGTRGHPRPFQFALQLLLAGGFLFLLVGKALLLLLQPGRVIALPGNAPATVQFEDPAGDIVQEVAVVRHADNRSRIVPQMTFKPGD